jgi:ABC-2 type transport system ATP-binding protein
MLQVEQISKKFGKNLAVNQLDLSVQKGQICGLLGPNGAGKSTAIRMICGVLVPNSGSIEIDGVNLSTHPTRAKQSLGYVPEGAPLPLELHPVEYLSIVASIYGLKGDDKKHSIAKWADRCEIADVLQKPIGTLSRGYRQRVALSAALIHQPSLLVLDEPTTGLDPSQRASFHLVLRNVAEHAAVLYSSHHLAEVEASCDVIAIINHGRLIANHSFSESKNTKTKLVEVSSEEVAEFIEGKNVETLENGWVRCSVENSGEIIADLVQQCGGKIRLLQPTTQTLEMEYLELIRESNRTCGSGNLL